jgi:hypothetical protein
MPGPDRHRWLSPKERPPAPARAGRLAAQSPHLVQLAPPGQGGVAWQWLARYLGRPAPLELSLTVVANTWSFDALFAQLK